ncbi:uncharacterized protein LOC119597804 isoform X2 [Penaeus monodon]|uniref:uncharacterized protein LOC119597804 isoform X2 n=1 Tax=Penaeus monodon TaxID=6687 RepID=UPI0018A6E418|nr:uncharacterized protein LOC119597804 isoform X2 [Penaeus monodon]
MNDKENKTKDISMTSVVRRRVYSFGFACMLAALGQVGVYLFMLAVCVRQEYQDVQVASASGIMAAMTGVYAFLTGRLMFLLYEVVQAIERQAEFGQSEHRLQVGAIHRADDEGADEPEPHDYPQGGVPRGFRQGWKGVWISWFTGHLTDYFVIVIYIFFIEI